MSSRFLAFVFAAILSLHSMAGGESKDVVRILAIGNSFSEDAIDSYFSDICKAAGKKVVTGNMIIGGCPLSKHLLNARTDSATYRFRRIGLNGTRITVDKVRPSEAIGSDDWDVVTFQQASPLSGKYGSFVDLDSLMYYVKAMVRPDVRYMWHQTWAYAPGSTHSAFPNYGSDQIAMYASIVSASRRVVADYPGLERVIPSGAAIQNARRMSGNADLTRDGYHLDYKIGRYIAACTWFEAIFGESVLDNTFVPAGLTESQARLAREAAHAACLSPFGE